MAYDEKIVGILDYINNHLHEQITLDLLEEKFYVSKYYLCHLFRKNTGVTVGEYTSYKRILKAKTADQRHAGQRNMSCRGFQGLFQLL